MEKTKRKHVLVVEDSPDLQFLVTRFLEGENFIVSRSNNGREALDLLRSMVELPAFILLDIMMPIMDGFEFRREQLKDPRLASIPVVVMTAHSDPEARAKDLGLTKILKKPITLDALIEAASSY